MANLAANIVREYDIRGVVGKDLFPEDAYYIGRALATKALAQQCEVINVGYDGRHSSPEISQQLIKGILDSGCNVNNIGLVPSPLLYFSVYHLQVAYGVIVTASHNPKEYNGFKILSLKEAYYGQALQEFAEFVRAKNFAVGQGQETKLDLKADYLKALLKELKSEDLSELKIAWDPACGAAGEIVAELTKQIAAEHYLINETIDGDFPAHDPDPTIEKNLNQLKELVAHNQANVGLAFDGDADRIGVIDDEGEVLWGDQLVTLYASEVLANNPGATIIADVKSSRVFDQKITEFGGKPLIWKTGHSLIKAKMKETGSLLAGEMSGHVFFKDRNFGYDDGIYAAVRLLKILAENNLKLSDYRKALPQMFSTKEEKVSCADEQKFAVIAELKTILEQHQVKFLAIDGVRVETESGWWLIRASNTSPYLVTRAEATSAEQLQALQQELNEYLRLVLPS